MVLASQLTKLESEKSPLDEEALAALESPIGRAFMLPERWSAATCPFFGQKGNLNTWLVTEEIAFDVGGSTVARDVALKSPSRFNNIYLDICYSEGYVEVKMPTDEIKSDVVEIYSRIRDSTNTNIVFLAIVGHISGDVARGMRIARKFGFAPTLFTWMDVWEPSPFPRPKSFPERLLERMFSQQRSP